MITQAAAQRQLGMLRTALGLAIADALSDPCVVEIMVNPDGRLWLDTLGKGCIETDIRLDRAQVERIIRLVASRDWQEAHREAPLISTELELGDTGEGGARFEGVLPPVVPGPCFAIRKAARSVLLLPDYVRDEVLTPTQADFLQQAVRERRNILIAGGTSSGKTTLANALLAEMAELNERVVLIEDTRELHCPAPDVVALKTRPGIVSMGDLVRSTMRLRPDRIIVGEVRGSEALDMLKAWNTGHPGGVATIHANGPMAALFRVEQLVQEAVVTVPRHLIAEAINLIIFIAGRGLARRVEVIAEVAGLTRDGSYRLIHHAS